MLVLLNSEKQFNRPLMCYSKNLTHELYHPASVEEAFANTATLCRWFTFTAECPVVAHPLTFAIDAPKNKVTGFSVVVSALLVYIL